VSMTNPRTTQFTVKPKGPFSLERLAMFSFGHRHKMQVRRSGLPVGESTTGGTRSAAEMGPAGMMQVFDGTMRMAFVTDDHQTSAAVVITQNQGGELRCELQHSAPEKLVRAQIMRVLSLDHNGDAFTAMCEQDPILSKLVELAPGLRPPLFHSPYEAAAWSIVSARRSAAQMSKVWAAMSEAHGETFAVNDQSISAFPTPTRLEQIEEFPGLDATKIERLHGIAAAALNGQLDVDRIHKLGPEAASKELQTIKGIGPFYASLITIRASGFVDIAPTDEPNALQLAGQLYGPYVYGSTAPFTPEQFAKLAEGWKPFRTWAAVLLRSTGPKLAN
jgi:DNA-3-methyladenine glycosylase II